MIPSILAVDRAQALRVLERLPAGATTVELRADRLAPGDVREIVGGTERAWIVAARRTAEGGGFDGPEEDRLALLRAALDAGARWIDVELGSAAAAWADSPLSGRTLLSHHGGPCTLDALRGTHARMAATSADRYKIVPRVERAADGLALREFLASHGGGGTPLCAFGLGSAGAWTRLTALAWGSSATYAAPARNTATAAGQFTVDDLESVYDVRGIGPATGLVALVGGAHILPGSPSPAMHNAGYRACGLDRRYLPLPCDSWDDAWRAALGGGFTGLAVTMPFKADAARAAGQRDRVTARSGAANTLLIEEVVHAANTDGPAALALLEAHGLQAGDSMHVLGGGGTGRAIAVAATIAGVQVTLYRREPDPRQPPPAGVEERRLVRFEAGGSDWLVNATPQPDAGGDGTDPPARKGVLDAVYGAAPTPLVRRARAAGIAAIDGLALLVAQAELQFRLQTGRKPPPGLFAETGQRYLAALG